MKRSALFLLFCVPCVAVAQDTVGFDNSKLLPVLWHQHAAEYRALCYQAFNMATIRLKEAKIRKRHRYAIITDVDETILDNSYYEAERIRGNQDFEMTSWKEWISKSAATPLPGSVVFFQLAAKKGVEVFYISNRDTSDVASTVANLRRLGFPNADESHMLFLKKTSSKEDRRNAVLKEHRILLMLGDNLNDFAMVFEKKETKIRNEETDKLRNEWGHSFIVLPNVIYGEWENALLNYSRKLTPAEKESILREKLLISPP